MGRARVCYYWPVKNDAETGWLRVSTPHAGNGKGQMFTPEVGSPVLVGYEQSQPEFALVLDNIFHPQNPRQTKHFPLKGSSKELGRPKYQ
ncbi:phage baseplate assembly protein V [Hymenobacter sp. H14-R3]|nr:phage baseplate assembly protein V [Hymenobacter sp. H14-R3]MDJ0366158.1 phage baseplate assembly protein V [Hymenobacter sp. H14-R3]